MNCPKCYAVIPDGAPYCPNCGEAVQQPQQSQQYQPNQPNQQFQPNQQYQQYQPNQQFQPDQQYQQYQQFQPDQQYQQQENTSLVFCTHCGIQNDANAVNCVSCGAPLTNQAPAQNAPQKQKKSFFKQKWFIFSASGLVAVILAVAIILGLTSSPKPEKYIELDDFYVAIESGNETKLLTSDGEIIYQSQNYYSEVMSADGNYLAFVEYPKTEVEDSYNQQDVSGTLYLVSNGKYESIKENVKKVSYISNGGKYIFYTNAADEFCQYDVSKKNEYIIPVDNDDFNNVIAAYSPNGKYLLYSVLENKVNNDNYATEEYVSTYYDYDYSYGTEYSDKKVKETVLFSKGDVSTVSLENFIPISITDNGKSIYGYVKDSSDIIIYSIVNDVELKIDTVSSTNFCLNYDATQLLYTSDGKTYLSDNFKEGVKIGNGTYYPIRTNYSSSVSYGSQATVYALSDLKDCFYRVSKDGSYEICYVDSKLEVTKIDSLESNGGYELHGNVLYYLDDESLYKVSKDDLQNPERLTRDVNSFWCTENGKYIYCLEKDGDEKTLYVLAGEEKTMLAEDVYNCTIDSKGNLFYICDYSKNEGDLYYCKGTKAERLETGVYGLNNCLGTIFFAYDYYAPSSGEATYSVKLQTSGKNFKIIGEDVTDFDIALP